MKKIGIFYGSTTGTTAEVAEMIAKQLGVAQPDVRNVSEAAPSDVAPYDVLLFGSSTWGDGDMQDDMHDFMDGISAMDLKGKKVAFFGCGDDTMSDTFCNAVGEMYKDLVPTGATPIGVYNTFGFTYSHTDADVDGRIVGLLIDNTNHEDLTSTKVKEWCDELKTEI